MTSDLHAVPHLEEATPSIEIKPGVFEGVRLELDDAVLFCGSLLAAIRVVKECRGA